MLEIPDWLYEASLKRSASYIWREEGSDASSFSSSRKSDADEAVWFLSALACVVLPCSAQCSALSCSMHAEGGGPAATSSSLW